MIKISLDIARLRAPARAALVAIGTSGPENESLRLFRASANEKQPCWRLGLEEFSNADIADLIDAEFLALIKVGEQMAAGFTKSGLEAWYAYSGLEPPPPTPLLDDVEVDMSDWKEVEL